MSRIAGKFGVTITPADAGIPLPNVAIRVDNLKLPAAWGNALGVVDGSLISLNLALNVTNPIVDVTIAGPKPDAIALRPFTIAKSVANSTPDSITHLVEVTKAHLLFAPLGGQDAANQPVSPGIAVVFDSYLGGRLLHVDAGVGLDPFPHLHADVNVPGFQIGTVTIDNTKLAIDLDANPSKTVAKLVVLGRVHRPVHPDRLPRRHRHRGDRPGGRCQGHAHRHRRAARLLRQFPDSQRRRLGVQPGSRSSGATATRSCASTISSSAAPASATPPTSAPAGRSSLRRSRRPTRTPTTGPTGRSPPS